MDYPPPPPPPPPPAGMSTARVLWLIWCLAWAAFWAFLAPVTLFLSLIPAAGAVALFWVPVGKAPSSYR